MTANVTIDVASVRDVLRIANAALRFKPDTADRRRSSDDFRRTQRQRDATTGTTATTQTAATQTAATSTGPPPDSAERVGASGCSRTAERQPPAAG